MADNLKQICCSNCGRVILEADLKDGIIRKKCEKCGTYNTIERRPADQARPFTDRLDLRLK